MRLDTFNHGKQVVVLVGWPLVGVSRKRDLGRI